MIKFYTWAIYRGSGGQSVYFVDANLELKPWSKYCQLDVSPFSEANMNCGSNLDEDSERENVYFSHYCYPCFGLFMKRDSFLFKHPCSFITAQLAVTKRKKNYE